MEKVRIYHEWCKDNMASLVRKVDAIYGGWPEHANSLVMQHCDSRECYFSASYPRDEWNTTVLTKKQYQDWHSKNPSNDNIG